MEEEIKKKERLKVMNKIERDVFSFENRGWIGLQDWWNQMKIKLTLEEQMQKFRDITESLSNEIKDCVEDSRGKSLCLTKLEEASFWLNKSITNND